MLRSLVIVLLLAGCLTPSEPEPQPDPQSPSQPTSDLTVASPTFEHDAAIPAKHTCDGANASPALGFGGAPANATVLALVMFDPDAPLPQAPARNITHWVWWNAPLANGSVTFSEGAVPAGTVEGANENGAEGYMGPCPPALSPAHRYIFHAYALAAPLDLAAGSTRAEIERAVAGQALAEGELTGLYARALPP